MHAAEQTTCVLGALPTLRYTFIEVHTHTCIREHFMSILCVLKKLRLNTQATHFETTVAMELIFRFFV